MTLAYISLIAAIASGAITLQTTPPEIAPSTTQPTTDAATIGLRVRVVRLAGDVTYKTSPNQTPIKVKVGDAYTAPTTIQTGQYSSVTLKIGDELPDTLVKIDSGSTVDLSEAAIVDGTKRTRLGLGYGKVRAGVGEGGIQSDFTVETPNATLSKRGTWNYGIEYERGTGRYRAFVLDSGLASVLNKSKGIRREVAVGQSVTDAMRLWNDESQIQRNVPIPDVLGQEDIQVAFSRRNNSGLGLLQPGDGRRPIFDLTQRTEAGGFSLFNRRAGEPPIINPPRGIQRDFPAIRRPEGDFGTGRGGDLIGALVGSGRAKRQR
ncbi:MAG: FecR domain-containing protein [Phycisphaerales bacterium]|nr:FecR domain-containing protein [Phycisphaerales bacterium]